MTVAKPGEFPRGNTIKDTSVGGGVVFFLFFLSDPISQFFSEANFSNAAARK